MSNLNRDIDSQDVKGRDISSNHSKSKEIKRDFQIKADIKQNIRRLLQETLIIAQEREISERRQFVRESLDYVQTYCKQADKTFIVCEEAITCEQFDLGGSTDDQATLFRGPSEAASVAICVTEKGSLLHRNDSEWRIYCDAGDVNPKQALVSIRELVSAA